MAKKSRSRRPKERIIRIRRKTKKPTILGIDCSSSTIGWGLLTLEKMPKLVSYGHIKPLEAKKGDIITRLSNTFNRIQGLVSDLDPSVIYVEEIKKSFKRGMSSAQTITVLAGFNRVTSVAASLVSNKEIKFINESTVRTKIKELLSLGKKIEKDEVPSIIVEHLDKRFKGPLNTKGNVAVETGDEADGIAVAWAGCLTEIENGSI